MYTELLKNGFAMCLIEFVGDGLHISGSVLLNLMALVHQVLYLFTPKKRLYVRIVLQAAWMPYYFDEASSK